MRSGCWRMAYNSLANALICQPHFYKCVLKQNANPSCSNYRIFFYCEYQANGMEGAGLGWATRWMHLIRVTLQVVRQFSPLCVRAKEIQKADLLNQVCLHKQRHYSSTLLCKGTVEAHNLALPLRTGVLNVNLNIYSRKRWVT